MAAESSWVINESGEVTGKKRKGRSDPSYVDIAAELQTRVAMWDSGSVHSVWELGGQRGWK